VNKLHNWVRVIARQSSVMALAAVGVCTIAASLDAQGLSPQSPSKEYIRFNGKVIAIEQAQSQGPSIVASPSAGSGSTQVFTIRYTSTNQSQEHFFFNSSLTGNGACYLIYDRPSGNLFIVDDQGSTASQSVTPGGGGTLSNSQCSVPASSASVATFGNSVAISATITFTPSFAGAKNIYATIHDSSGNVATWQQIGTWTVTTPANNSITATPSSGSGVTQTFTFAFTSSSQNQEHVFFNSTLTGNGACYLIYDRPSGNLLIANDQGSAVSESVTPGGSGVLSNSQCSVPASTASVSTLGNTVILTATITFAPSFAGPKNIYGEFTDASGNEGPWQQFGSWTP